MFRKLLVFVIVLGLVMLGHAGDGVEASSKGASEPTSHLVTTMQQTDTSCMREYDELYRWSHHGTMPGGRLRLSRHPGHRRGRSRKIGSLHGLDPVLTWSCPGIPTGARW